MKLSQITAAALGAAALTLFAGSAKAADTVDFAAAGSSAQYSTFTSAFINQGYTNHYTLGSSSNFQVVEKSVAGVPNENAQVAIYWQGSAGNYRIAVFYQVDSTVGVRAFFNNDTLTASSTPPAGANLGAPGSGDAIPPAEVLSTVNGSVVNVGATDITPEDARVATQRSLNLGYKPGTPIVSAVNTGSVATPVPFTLTAKPFALTAIGAVPIVVFVNSGPTFNSSVLTGANLNIDSFELAGFLSGQFDRTSDLNFAAGAAANPVHTYIREPLSGTYNTIEYTNAESLAKLAFTSGKQSGSVGVSGGQENGVATNPLNEPSSGSLNGVANAGRIRAVGTGQLVGAVNSDATDALGYAFYSAGTFSKTPNLRYLTVDGADPLQDNYNGGSLTGASVSFRNIINGGYPLWSILRVVTAQNPPSIITQIVNAAASSANGTDFVIFKNLRVFRSYHLTPFTSGTVSNGNNGAPANGGDVGGAVFSINNDVDFNNDFGSELTNLRQ